MICAVVASGLPQPVSWVAFTARTAWIHHLLRPPVTAPPHLPLRTQNEVSVTACIRLSRSRRGYGREFEILFECSGFFAFPPHPYGLSCLIICPSIIHFIFEVKVAVYQEIFFKIFSKLCNPALIERLIRLL